VEPLALNVLLCQVMVSMVTLSQREGQAQEPDAEWLMPLRGFVQETLSSGAKLSQRHLHTLLETVWRMVITQRSRGKTVWVCVGCQGCSYEFILNGFHMSGVLTGGVCSGDGGSVTGGVCSVPADEPESADQNTATFLL
jgi:hypothetical protein